MYMHASLHLPVGCFLLLSYVLSVFRPRNESQAAAGCSKYTVGSIAMIQSCLTSLIFSACHGAIKFGDVLSQADGEQMIEKLAKCKVC